MLQVSLRDDIDTQTLHQMRDKKDIVVGTRGSKLRWAGHAAHLATSRVIEWYQREKNGRLVGLQRR